MWRAALVVLVACGSNAPGAETDAAAFVETGPFVPRICTSGLPDEPTNPNPNCPVNEIPLGELGADAMLRFIAQSIASGMYVTGVEVTAGDQGLYLEHIQIVSWHSDPPLVMDAYPGVVLNIPPNETATVGSGSSAFVGTLTDQISFRFDAIGPFRP